MSPLCEVTGKRVFADAAETKKQIGRRTAIKAYVCRFCGQLHVGHRRGQSKGAGERGTDRHRVGTADDPANQRKP